ncbi:hypothetical protein [Pleionea litopenaei]|uniref:Uncharacterized protein n=1 Tax=Pleionea litopenaei TaxID=3070815 RepID=A0AA51X6H1_9GAMM|nr:hypothetical protein [Pleionea sp. HL-JVS1]WMS86816.1 hypothetical protein Q9312_16470 [Pleionea sp. HL-JVS1]
MKNKKAIASQANTVDSKPERPLLNSHRHLSFAFSNEIDETFVWLTVQECGELSLIDVYQYGDSEQNEFDTLATALFYKVASYPKIPLDQRIKNGEPGIYLREELVVNDLDSIKHKHKQKKKLMRISESSLDTHYIDSMLKKICVNWLLF